MMDATGDLSKWATLAIGLAVSVAVVALTVVSLGAAAPAAACTLAMVGTSIGLSYTTAVGVATAATYTVVATASLYAGDIAYSSITGTSPVKEIMFNGNQEAYEDGLLLVSMATAGMLDMATYSPGICFVAGTEVLASSGTVVIENVKAGDYVWASNPETGEVSLKQVVQTFVNETNELVHVQVKDEEIICTNEHPFYLPTRGWVAACELRAGDILVTVNGEYVVVEKIQHDILENPVKVYNFEVEDFHTYYISGSKILVHNSCGQNGEYQKASYHNKGNSLKSAAPINGQDALDNSVSIGSNTMRRVGVSNGQFVVLDETYSGVYHGHVRTWGQLTQQMKNALIKANLVNRRGKIK